MARTVLLASGIAGLVAWSWARLEEPRSGVGEILVVVLLALIPALFRGRLRVAGALVAALAAGSIALDVSPHAALPFDDRDFVATLARRGWNGFLGFYDVTVPFDGVAHPFMHGALLMAVFLFALLGALAVSSRRPALVLAAFLVGTGWPATILPGSHELFRGVVLLAAGLVLLATVQPGHLRFRSQLFAGGAVTMTALALSASGAVARTQFVDWQSWDPYNKPDAPVGVSYVWRANYDGIKYPAKRTRVLRVRAAGRATYWRATTLDSFADDRWLEDLRVAFPAGQGTLAEFSRDALSFMPRGARDRRQWTRADVLVDALRDSHLVGASVPVAYDTRNLPAPHYASGGVGFLPRVTQRGDEYSSWGYAPRPTPSELEKSSATYPAPIANLGLFLNVERGISAPPFGDPDRSRWAREAFAFRLRPYAPLYREALRIAGRARNPYAATVALEAWFRTGGGFTYDESPPKAHGAPLVFFVTRSKAGYCQHFAGAMALMLRYLGIPARVAAGFTSGNYNREKLEWTVSDRNAHTWVEVWFKGYGWLPFDPTPGRGNLSGPYSASSFSFDAPGARAVLLGSALAADTLLKFQLDRQRGRAGGISPRDRRGAGGEEGGGATIGAGQILIASILGLALLLVAFKVARRRSRYLTRDPRRVATACRREIVDFLADQRIDVPPSATLEELRRMLDEQAGVDPRRFVEALGAARYGPLGSATGAARRARLELRVVRKSLRRALSRSARLRGAVSLRSLLTS